VPDWRIDTLDARGGLAFATWGEDNLTGGLNASSEPYCIFVGPPDFRPEPVANRSMALAAGRGAFQTGLFVEGVEVPFPTPTAVAEFVRRTYLRGGGGDGIDGGGGETPPPRPVERPDLPRFPESTDEEFEGRRLRPEILNAVKTFLKWAQSVELGQPKPFKWPAPVDTVDGGRSTSTAGDGPAMLASAALKLIYEMAQRLPSTKDSHALARWQRDARRLGNLLSRLDLWPLLLGNPYYRSLATLAKSLVLGNHGLAVLDVIKSAPLTRYGRFSFCFFCLSMVRPWMIVTKLSGSFTIGITGWIDTDHPASWRPGPRVQSTRFPISFEFPCQRASKNSLAQI
jgi:hypothetical protein